MYGPGVDMVLSEQQFAGGVAQSPQYQLTDHLGTVRGIAQRVGGASSATLVNAVQYDAFGKVTSQSNATNQPHHGFAGRDIEPVGGLTYNRNRYYSTSSGRFISQDPISFAAGDANLYRYVGNESTMYTDPSGLERSVTLPNGTVFVAQGTGHHVTPWSVFSNQGFPREVLEVFDGGGKGSLINGSWYNFHDGTAMSGITHEAYSKAVAKELAAFKRGYRKFGPKEAQGFLDHLNKLPSDHSIRVFNAGITAEKKLANEIGDILYEQYKKDSWYWTRDSTLDNRVRKKVGGYVRELRNSKIPKKEFIDQLIKEITSQLPAKRLTAAAIKRIGSAVFVWTVLDQVAKDGKVHASEIPNAIALNAPILGDAIQAGQGLGYIYLYLLEESNDERTGDEWASSSSIYDPKNNCFRTNTHGVTP
jgi:RHS repeat-associated protein